jgi:hypothetical protein
VKESDCNFISKWTQDYNCVGLAVGDYRYWHPVKQREHHWPEGVPRNYKVESYLAALSTVHFEECEVQSPDPEPGYEKVVVYHFGGKFTHVALIASTSVWKSKLGRLEDIEHPPAPEKLGKYGFVFKYLRREVKYAGGPLPDEYRL